MGDPARKLPSEAHPFWERLATELPRALEEWGVTSPKLQRAILETVRERLDGPVVLRRADARLQRSIADKLR